MNIAVENMSRICAHFGECGGCQHQDASYEAQLAHKARLLEKAFAPYWREAISIEPSPLIWHYRNKIDPSFAGKYYAEPPPKGFERELVLGFKKRWYWTLDLDECLIAPEGASELLRAVRDWGRAHKLPPCDPRTGKGLLRMLLVREGKRTGERMVVLVTHDGEIDGPSFVDVVQAVYPAQSIQHATFRGTSDVLGADELAIWHGAPHIHEELRVGDGDRRLRFRISPLSFFQTNTLAAERMYGVVRGWVSECPPGKLYDLYGGSGAFALVCSDHAGEVVSVEETPSATEDGRYNATLNAIDNVQFANGKVEHFLRDAMMESEGLDRDAAVIADPPRPGLHPKALKRLMEWGPREVVYVSCKYTELLRELETFAEAYRLADLRAVDLFPHTDHVEVLARLVRHAL